MANDLTGAIWKIDTVFTTPTDPVKIVNAIWNEGAIGDEITVESADGRVIMESVARIDNDSQNFYFVGYIPNGITVPTLDSGVLLITTGAGR